MAKLKNNQYNYLMQKFNYLLDLQQGQWSGQRMTDLIDDVHGEYQHFLKARRYPELILYYRDLLSYLVKNHGH